MLRAAIIGCGRIGCGFDDDPRRGYVSTHAGAYAKTDGVVLAAMSDVQAEPLQKYGDKFQVAGRYADYKEMLAREHLDIVSVCTLADTHLPIVRDAAKAGVKAIFCEKPIADTLTAADEIIALCKAANVVLLIDHQRRFEQSHRKLAAFIRGGGLGRIQQVTCYYVGGIANTGTHLFDFLRFLLGDAVWVEGYPSINASSNVHDPAFGARIGFANGPVASVLACDAKAYALFEITLFGANGRLRITSVGAHVAFDYEEARESQWGVKELFPAPSLISDAGPHEYMIEAMQHLVDCVQNGKTPYSTGEDGRAALAMICAVHESADASGKRIHLPLQKSLITLHSR